MNKLLILKALGWRVIASLITVIVARIVSGSWGFGLLVGGIDTLVKLIFYFIYDKLWLARLKQS